MPESDDDKPKRFLRLRRRWNGPGHEASQWPAPRPAVTDPREMLASNLARERQAGRYHLKRRKPRSGRRIWDFLVMIIAGNGAGTGYLLWAEANQPTVLIVGSAMLFYTLVICWVTFVNIDEY